jgi:hypothetical protein
MGGVAAKSKGQSAKRVRSPRVRKGVSEATGSKTQPSHSPLRDEIWAMVTDHTVHFGCTHDEALALANKHNGVVMTDRAASRIHGFNELAEGNQ